ncbi:hypothetical protein BEP19_09975 [Ammoniphilus oxalaticus]|uniref:Uncharacterized protein n=1 Tax=Ammoniphilus oxalaticus TaxID=66863 RepID=A0A419SFM3_9BACL|nr:hypothetical protein BEP19_09975 [Ammoniphilus oxalaticus]
MKTVMYWGLEYELVNETVAHDFIQLNFFARVLAGTSVLTMHYCLIDHKLYSYKNTIADGDLNYLVNFVKRHKKIAV